MRVATGAGGAKGVGGGFSGALAVGCPVWDKVVVALLGAAGAMQWWAPVQPLLGAASVALSGWALQAPVRAERLPGASTTGV
jgi:hypothetical protein